MPRTLRAHALTCWHGRRRFLLSRGAPPPLVYASHASRSRAYVLAWPLALLTLSGGPTPTRPPHRGCRDGDPGSVDASHAARVRAYVLAWPLALELNTQGQLDPPLGIRGRKVSVRRIGLRHCVSVQGVDCEPGARVHRRVVRTIEDVVCLGPELHRHSLGGQGNLLEQGHIPVIGPRSPKQVLARVAQGPWGRRLENHCMNVARIVDDLHAGSLRGTTPRGTAEAVAARRVDDGHVVEADGQGRTALKSRYSRPRPVIEYPLQPGVAPVFCEVRKLPRPGAFKDVRTVVAGRAVIPGFLTDGKDLGVDDLIVLTIGVIQDPGQRVREAELQLLREAAADHGLQRVVG